MLEIDPILEIFNTINASHEVIGPGIIGIKLPKIPNNKKIKPKIIIKKFNVFFVYLINNYEYKIV